MKIFTSIEKLWGKKPYYDERLKQLGEKFSPSRITFFSLEFTPQREQCQVLVVDRDTLLELILEDIERAESLRNKDVDKEIVNKALSLLNKEKALSEILDNQELILLKNYSFITVKPIIINGEKELVQLQKEIFKKLDSIFFFTVNNKEAKAWLIKEGSSILDAAGKIHTDLAKGFIRGEVFNMKDWDNFKNLNEARKRGFLKVVNKDYVIEDGDVINIKHSKGPKG